jgi:hypothetical protein
MTASELLAYGFRYSHRMTCCGGVKNEIYSNGEYQIRLRQSQRIFKIMKGTYSLTSFLSIDRLKPKLDELEILEKKANV